MNKILYVYIFILSRNIAIIIILRKYHSKPKLKVFIYFFLAWVYRKQFTILYLFHIFMPNNVFRVAFNYEIQLSNLEDKQNYTVLQSC